MNYDLIILENDFSAQQLAVNAARQNQTVAIIHTATASNNAPAFASFQQAVSGGSKLWSHVCKNAHLIQNEWDANFEQLCQELLISRHFGSPEFSNAHQIKINADDASTIELTGETIVIATGARPRHLSHLPVNGKTILHRTQFYSLAKLPKSILYAADQSDNCFLNLLESLNVTITRIPDFSDIVAVRENDSVEIELINGRRFSADAFVLDVGQQGCTENLNLDAAGLTVDDRGQLWCNDDLQTWVPNIYGLGEVVGYSGLMETTEARADFNRIPLLNLNLVG